MRSLRALLAVLIFGGAVTLAQACASSGVSAEAAGVLANNPNAAVLKVTNNNFQDMDVFVSQGAGITTRLGTVTGAGGSGMFVLDPAWVATNRLSIVATPIGGGGRASSGPIMVNRGDEVDFTISPELRGSSVIIH